MSETQPLQNNNQFLTTREILLAEKVVESVIDVFKIHGAMPSDIPIFKKIPGSNYNLNPDVFQFMVQNKIDTTKSFFVTKILTQDQAATGRDYFRQYRCCDLDFVGVRDFKMTCGTSYCAEAEILKIVSEIFRSPKIGLDLGEFLIKVNDTNILEGIMKACGVPEEKIGLAISLVQKIADFPWQSIKDEILNKLEISEQAAQSIKKYVSTDKSAKLGKNKFRDSNVMKLINKLKSDPLLKNESMEVGLANIEKIMNCCHFFGLKTEIQFDLSFVTGFDYYKGFLFEASLCGTDKECSVSGGGSYVGSINSSDDETKQLIPCVGMSLGIENLIAVIDKKEENKLLTTVKVLVHSIERNLTEMMKFLALLWENGIAADFQQTHNMTLPDVIKNCREVGIPVVLFVGERGLHELRFGKNLEEKERVNRETVIDELKTILKLNENQFDDSLPSELKF